MDWTINIAWTFGLLMVLTAAFAPLMRSKYGFLLGAALYSLVDVVQGAVGLWTLTGALSWGLVGFLFTKRNPSKSIVGFLGLSVGGTLLFDFLTGPVASPLLWGMPFTEALIGQVPFTLSHLIGNAALTAIFAPFVYAFAATQKNVRAFLLASGVYKPKPSARGFKTS